MIRVLRTIVVILLATIKLPYIYGQDILGTVVDSNGCPIQYANVSLLTKNDTIFIKGEVTDSIGEFNFKPIDENIGPYMIKVCALGYQDTCVLFHHNPCEIRLKESVHVLNEVIVNGDKKVFRQTPRGIKTNVAGTPLCNLSSVGEILAYIPGLFKNSQGNYQIAGKGFPVFYINGRRVYDNYEIESLSPTSIKDVEIIRNPGVSYDANITAIVKISTQKALGEGFSINLRSSYYYWTNSDYVEQINWNYRNKGWDIFGNHSYISEKTTVQSYLTQILYGGTIWQQKNHQDAFNNSRSFKNTVGANWEWNDNNNIGIKYSIDFPLNTLDKGSLNSKIYTDGEAYDQLSSHNSSKHIASARHHVNAYYRANYNKLTLGADFDFLNNRQSNFNTYSEKSENHHNREVQTEGITSNILFASKVFSELNISKWTFSIGIDYSWTSRKNDYSCKDNFIDSQNDNIRETHLSPYFDINWNIGNCQIIGGVRYEKVWSNFWSNDHYTNKDYSNIYPNVSVFLPLGNVSVLASYSIKDKKPSYAMLRNEVTYGNRFTYQTGNPYLKPEKIHNINLSMVYRMFQFVLGYTDRRNAILYSADFYKDSPSIALISFCNIPTLKNITGSVSINQSIGLWDPTFTLAVTKQWFTTKTAYGEIQLNKPILMTNFSNMFNFGKGWRANINLNYTSKGDSENCKLSRSTFCVDFRIYKYFLNNNLSLSVGVTDLFDSQKSGNILYLNNLNTTQIEWRDNREMSITLTYRFNSTKGRYKGDGAGKEEQERL